jgi:cysteine-rich repeat protein
MYISRQIKASLMLVSLIGQLILPYSTLAQEIATTSVNISNCGDSLVTAPEECDVPGEIGSYSTTIIGRQCNNSCEYGPYCGDGILQTIYNEECDDANNTDNDFCSALCIIEPSGNGGGGSSGGGSGSGSGDDELGDTQINVEGLGYPNRTVNILLDSDSVGTVRTNNDGEFDFAIGAEPGPATLGFWSIDAFSTRSVTLTTTFDVTQGAVTNVRGILIPPTIKVNSAAIDPGAILTISGQAPPVKLVQVYLGSEKISETTSNNQGDWSVAYDTSRLAPKEYTLKANYRSGTGALSSVSSYSTAVALFVGVAGKASTPSDLNRDGKINLIDFSILIFWWGTNGGNSNPPADINGNARVGLEDFSILLFNWTG